MDLRTLLFSFSGRLNRAKYWFVVLINVVVSIGGNIAAAMAGGTLNPPESDDLTFFIVFIVGAIAVAVFGLWTGIAAAIKRLHDREKSGWWILLFGALPAILAGTAALAADFGIVLAIAAVAIWVWGIVEIGCLKGTEGPNAYGPDPIGTEIT